MVLWPCRQSPGTSSLGPGSFLFPSLLNVAAVLHFDAVAILRNIDNGKKDVMASFQSNQRQVTSEKSDVSILYVADRSDLTAFHSAHLRDAGYQVQLVSSSEEALAAMQRTPADVVVIGHGLSLADRTEIEAAVRQQHPKPRIVLLYEISIAQTEQADAVLNINSEPQHLVQTIRYLLTGAISDRPN
jgi:CheY-like chemotaxis protein